MERISEKKFEPAYLSIYRKLREAIVGGAYVFGERLPSKRTLAEKMGFSTITAAHAYSLLCDEGYIEARERSGYFVIFRKSDGFVSTPFIEKKPAAPRDAQNYPHFPFSVFAKTMRTVLSIYGEQLLESVPCEGAVQLREALARYLARNRGIQATAQQIVIGSGAEYIYGLIIELLGRERKYGIEAPSYEKIEYVYRAKEACYLPLPLSHDGIESGALQKTQASVLHTTPYRSFPSGITASATKRYEYIRWSKKPGRYIIEDDFESEFSISKKPEDTLFSLSDQDNVIYLNTFSKTVSPSLRVGYMVLPKHLVSVFKEKLGFYSCTVPTLEQLVIAALIENGDFERHINRVRRSKRKQLEIG